MVTDLLVLKLGEDPRAPVAWGAFADGALVEAGGVEDVAGLATLAHRFAAARVAAVIPGEQVAVRPLDAPPRAGARLAAAARMLLEDELAEPVDDLHIIVSQRGAGTAAAAISKARVREWLTALDATGLSVSELTADFLAAPCAAGECVFIADKARIIASRGDAGFAAEDSLAADLAPGLARSASNARLIGYGDQSRLTSVIAAPFEPRPLLHQADLLGLYASTLERGKAGDFLTGAFRRRKAGGFRFAPYKRASMIGGAALAASFAVFVAGAFRDHAVAARYEERARQAHAAAFPAYTGDDLRGHARSVLSQGQSTAAFLELNTLLAEAVESTPGLAVDRVRYDAASGRFSFNVRSTTDTAIEALRADLAARGIAASDEGGHRRSGDVWIGEMSVQGT